MGFLRDILAVFKKQQHTSLSNQFFSETIDDLFGYLTSRITSSNQSHATAVHINNYLKLKSNERKERLAESYLFIEKYLTDIDPNFDLTKEQLRERIKVQYATLLSIQSFALIFEEESQQEFDLCRMFLKEVLTGLTDLLGEQGSQQLTEIRNYLDDIPNGFPSQNPLNDRFFNPSNFNDWVHFLRRLSFHTFTILKEKVGEQTALRRFDHGYKILAKQFINLDSFQIIISVLPESLMDEDRVGALTKHQIEKLLLKKADHFEQLTKDLSEKNEELEKTQRLLIEAKNKAEEATKAKAMFLANMSHEIRTPMNAVIGMTEILRETNPSKEQLLYIETIYKSGYDLIHIINDILDYSKIESGRLELEQQPVSLQNLTADLGNLLVLKAEEKNIELIFHVDEEVPPTIISDAVRLKQILTNLLGNAIKFTKVGEVVLDVSLREIKDGEATLEFQVKDTGIGIPPNKIDNIFDSFSQVDTSTTRNYGGTGLGLTITRSLVNMLGGEIWVNSLVGEGSTFTFTIKADLEEAEYETDTQFPLFEGKTILIADQNKSQRQYLNRRLSKWGMIPHAYASLQELILNMKKISNIDGIITEEFLITSADKTLQTGFYTQLKSNKIPIIYTASFGKTLETSEEETHFKITRPIRREDLIRSLQQAFSQELKEVEEAKIETYHQLRPISILVAEDNPTNQLVAKGLMRNIGYEIDIVDNGEKVLELLDHKFYDLILMDVQMPLLDGLQTTKKIRMRMMAPKQPIIIAMTANASEEDKQVCLFSGMNDYLSKPVTRNEIISKIEHWFPFKEN